MDGFPVEMTDRMATELDQAVARFNLPEYDIYQKTM
jgi:hypothetical protein